VSTKNKTYIDTEIEDDDLDIDLDDKEIEADDLESDSDSEDDTDTQPKKKGRPKSEHYVKESELRDEIDASKKQKEKALADLTDEWNKKIDNSECAN